MSEVECPYCGEVVGDLWEYRTLQNDGDSTEITCEKCEKKYVILMYITVRYTAKKRVEDCEHKETFSKIYCDECDGLIKDLEIK
jgi:ribosomal protein S27E